MRPERAGWYSRSIGEHTGSSGSDAVSTIDFWEKPGCTGNARQRAMLTAAGHALRVHDVLHHGLSRSELRSFFGARPVHQWFNMSAPVIKRGDLNPGAQTEEEALSLMEENPLLIRRPLLQIGTWRAAGFEIDQIELVLGPLGAAGVADGCAHEGTTTVCAKTEG